MSIQNPISEENWRYRLAYQYHAITQSSKTEPFGIKRVAEIARNILIRIAHYFLRMCSGEYRAYYNQVRGDVLGDRVGISLLSRESSRSPGNQSLTHFQDNLQDDEDLKVDEASFSFVEFNKNGSVPPFSGALFQCDIFIESGDRGERPYYLIRPHERLDDLQQLLTQGCRDFEILTIDADMMTNAGIKREYAGGMAIFIQEHDIHDIDHTIEIDGQAVSPGLNMGRAFRWLAEILPLKCNYRIQWEEDAKTRFKAHLFSIGNNMGLVSEGEGMDFLRGVEFREFFPAFKGSHYVLARL